MFLKTLAVSTSVIGTIVYTQYAAFSKDKDNRTHHPGRMHPTKLWDDNWDFMKPDKEAIKNLSDEEKVGMISSAVRHIYLVRHGQYEIGETEPQKRILTELGRNQAEITGERIQDLLGEKITHCYISTYPRAMETGHIILKHLDKEIPVDYSELVREGAPIAPIPAPEHWKPEPWEFHRDGARIEAAFRSFIHRAHPSQSEESHDIVVCHGNVIRYFVCRALQNDPEGWLRLSLANCSITHLVVKPNGNVTLRGLGEKGHLPSDMVTYN